MTGQDTPPNSHFLLVGNGPYQNRGCEAIVRGTMEILRQEFGRDLLAQAGVIAKSEVVCEQKASEIDSAVSTFALSVPGGPRWSFGWCAEQANLRLGASFYPHLKALEKPAERATVALEIGGDHYSLDYGKPLNFMAMDRFFLSRHIPVVLWGASVGPFDADPEFAPRIFDHLRCLSGIFVRESDSLDYLRANGVSENVYLMGDPAFVMRPVEPELGKSGFNLPERAIGINLSPMLAFYRGIHPADVDLNEWCSFCVELVKSAATLGHPILLIPHVGSSDPGNDDFAFLDALFNAVKGVVNVPVQTVPPGLNAAELKWIISKCAIFAGARTHSTIAAISSYVPTLSIGYSLKARGINRDVFGHNEYCLAVCDLSAESFTERLSNILDNEASLRSHLATSVPYIVTKAMNAGAVLGKIVDRHRCL